MARILCNVAGGGKPLKGNAETGDVLVGKTFSNKQSNALTGTMPNNGAWSASTSGNGSVTIPAGYHNGSGTVSGAASYKQGHDQGYNQGVSDADGRVNTSSASYNSGYANGHQTIKISGELWGTNDGSDYLATHVRNSSVSITIEKNSNIVATCSPIELRAGQIGMYVNGTHYTKGWNTGGTNSYNGTVPANSTVSFYTSAGGADTQRAGASFSLTVN